MIDWFSDIKYFYEKNLWTKKQVYDVVGKRITPEQYKEITGEDYIENSPPSEGTSGTSDGSVGSDQVNQESNIETAPVSE
ncbi:XkdX family protein [Bacillus inaquosorum]|uniref:XkdX family protein n=1 Tax=Bacillus inaquosorum TaxID=483913 RepID=UPI00227E0C91|nr:XkdX family protein [Bacillus inaquosorum]MCY8085107.1 XkdX family protein [Bacillus inaquosorum]MCY8126029.1 XkdX family protein [Bacillus spizizenii]